jgi:hypothetical protein
VCDVILASKEFFGILYNSVEGSLQKCVEKSVFPENHGSETIVYFWVLNDFLYFICTFVSQYR